MIKRGGKGDKTQKGGSLRKGWLRGGEGGIIHVKNTHEQRLNERSKSNFQTRNQTKLCDSKIKTQELQIRTRTRNVQDKHENKFLLC